MTTVLTAKLDGTETIRHFQLPVVATYLDIAAEATTKAECTGKESELVASVVAITFSVMAIEAFANQAAEQVIPAPELAAFMRMSGEFKVRRHRNTVLHKLILLWERSSRQTLPIKLVQCIETAIELRNHLVHYRVSETAGSVQIQQAPPEPRVDGSVRFHVDLLAEPIEVRPPFLVRVNAKAASACLAAAMTLIQAWDIPPGNNAIGA